MAVETKSQYFFTGQGPLDTKFLVSTYDQLKSAATWAVSGSTVSAAYNGMITAVNNNTTDKSKNGIYFFFDPKSNARVPVDVTQDENWHKIAELSDLTKITNSLAELSAVLNGTDTAEGLVAKVDSNTAAINEIKSSNYLKVEDLTDYAKTEDVVTTEAFSSFKSDNDAKILEIANTVSGKADLAVLGDYYNKTDADAKFATKESVAENTAKLSGIKTTVVAAIEEAVNNLPTCEITVATPEKLGGIKSASGENQVSVAEDGIASVQKININSLVQNKGDILILNGGDDGDPDETIE